MPIQKPSAIFLLFYATLVFALGIVGYKEAGSLASLYSGVIFGIITCLAAFLMLADRPLGCYLGALSAGVLAIVFCLRFQKSRDFTPAAMALCSVIVLFNMGYQIYQIYRTR